MVCFIFNIIVNFVLSPSPPGGVIYRKSKKVKFVRTFLLGEGDLEGGSGQVSSSVCDEGND